MAGHYSTRSFFRQIPNDLLDRYFKRRGLLEDFDFGTVEKPQPEALFAAWLELPEEDRNSMEAEFREIFEMGCEKGILAIVDEARWQWRNDPGRAMVTFLDHPECWTGATRFYHADALPCWRKRKNLGHRPAVVDADSLDHLADLIRTYFHSSEGRGKHCVVESYRRGELDYFFAYPEDYSRQQIEWVDGAFGRRPHNPAFEVVFVYAREEGTLDLNFDGPYRSVEPLHGMFATAILKLERLPPDPTDQGVYDLEPLGGRGFGFVYDIGSGIEKVTVMTLGLSSLEREGDRITVEADASENPEAVYDLLEQVAPAMPFNLYRVSEVELAAWIAPDAEKPATQVPIRIAHPNSCSLKYDERDLKLRAMLEASGIELQEPNPEAPA